MPRQLPLYFSLLAALAPSCRSPEDFRAEADRDVYALVQDRREQLALGRADFTVEPPTDALRSQLLNGEADGIPELEFTDALELAAQNSRQYQTRKERLYLAALDLTLERWRLSWNGTSGADAAIVDANGDRVASGSVGGALSRLFGGGLRLLSDIGLTVFRDISTGDAWNVVSDVGLTITQPLLRNSGRLVTREPLTQAERNLVYEVRAFERFRRTFAVDTATRFYRLLQQADRVRNQEQNAASLATLREKNENLAEAGRLSEIQVDQARQNELRSRDQLLAEVQRFADDIDQFKLFLGLPVTFDLTFREGLLRDLSDAGLVEQTVSSEAALATATRERLDLLTAVDRRDDTVRRIRVTETGLRTGFDITANFDLSSEDNKPLKFDIDDANWSFGAALDLPFNRTPQRNAYRAAFIAAAQAERNMVELHDTIEADVRSQLRTLEARRQSYVIQRNAVRLAERRVESARLNLDAGRAETRDLLEAQDSLINAQNSETRTLVDHLLARMALFRDMELLRIGPDGITFEPVPAPTPDAVTPPSP